MASVDDRVVRMEFDNAAFERKLESTIISLGTLEKALRFDSAKQGFSEVSSMADRFHLGNMGASIEGVSNKFLALSTIAITTLATITSKAISAGADIAKSLSLDLIISGFKEYELNMGSIQTILSNTKADGTNLEQVNSALDELNQYADKTIYNFGQMTKNIGTFTAAGVDLDTSVQSIKGISNLAAISGSSAEQASTAMYQLSQAVSTGTLKLVDWNSVVNAGMGGEVFQKALFESGKALQTIEGVPIDQTFEEWTAAGNSFRGSLQDGWLTSEVLTTTLQGFTGEMTEAQLLAIGYTKEQAAEIIELGKTGVEAATKVRTLTGLIETTKESIGSGWSESFRIVFGNFEEATELFSGASGIIGHLVDISTSARNDLLSGWKDLGGRTVLFDSIWKALFNIWEILVPIQHAFREVFPPMTAERLFALTQRFAEFADALKPSQQTVENLQRIFQGLFSALDIGWEIIKEGAKFIGDLFTSFTGAGSGQFLQFLANIGDFFTSLNQKLVEGGGIKAFFDDLRVTIDNFFNAVAAFIEESGVKEFFDELKNAVQNPAEFVNQLKDNILGLFDSIDVGVIDTAGNAFGRFGERFETLKSLFDRAQDLWEPFKNALETIGGILDDIWDAISNWFSELGTKLANVMGEGDFDAVLDLVNIGLLGGIAAILAKFLSGGFNFDIGSGFFDKIGDSFKELTGVLSAMQTDLKAEALLKIAGAIAILTASVLVLSLIDSEALTKALFAMAIGFGQLVGAFAILTKMSSGPSGAAQLTVMAGGMILMAGAILILALAAESLSDMSWEELAKGLGGVTILMGIMTAAALILSQNTSGLVRAGIGMIGIAIALNILAGAVKIFATMSWEEMGRGFAAVAGGLLIIVTAMRLMPPGLALQGVGLMLVATSLAILAGVVKLFAAMSWSEMGKGFAAIAGGLIIIAGAMHLMPVTMPLIGAGLLLVSVSLIAIAQAMSMMGGLSWEEIGKGLATMAGALLILAVATNAMSGAILGAIAIGVVSASLLLLVEVLKELAKISWGDLLKGLVGIAAVLAVLAIGALLIQPAIPALLGLGASLLLIGAGFALFGFGASLVAEAFERLADAGEAGSESLVASLEAIGKALPALMKGFAEGILELVQILVDAAPVLVKGLVEILQHLLEGLGKLIPEVMNVISVLITELLTLISEKYPEFVEAGLGLLVSLLTGIRNQIGEIVTLVLEIVTEFINALTENIGPIITAGVNFLIAFIQGITDNVFKIAASVTELITKFIEEFGKNQLLIITAGVDLLIAFLKGITDNLVKVVDAVVDVIVKFCDEVSANLWRIADAATSVIEKFCATMGEMAWRIATAVADMIIDFIEAVAANLWRITNAATSVIVEFCEQMGDSAWRISSAVATMIIDFVDAISTNLWRVTDAAVDVILEFANKLGDSAIELARGAADMMIDFLNALADVIDEKAPELRDAGGRVAIAIIDGITGGMASKAANVAQGAIDVAKGALSAVGGFLGIGSPSRVFMEIGGWMAEGMAIGLDNDETAEKSAVGLVDRTTKIFTDSLSKITDSLGTIEEFNPTITPVLDLTRVAADAKQISGYIQGSEKLIPTFSIQQARTIASSQTEVHDDLLATKSTGPAEVKFEQNIYAPKQLSTSDIYRSTRNQIQIAKQELSIP